MEPQTSNVTRRSVARGPVVLNHLGKQLDIVIAFARHLFTDRMEFFEKMWTTIHKSCLRLFPLFTHQEFRSHNFRRIKTGGRIEELDARLPMNAGEMSKIPRHQIVDLMK